MDYSQLRATVKKYAGQKGEPEKLLVDFSTILSLLRDLDVANRALDKVIYNEYLDSEMGQQLKMSCIADASREIEEKG